eukprot:472747_1
MSDSYNHLSHTDVVMNLADLPNNEKVKMIAKCKQYGYDNPNIYILSENEELVCQHIKQQLCVALGISPSILNFTDIGNNVGLYLQAFIEDEKNVTIAKLKQLQFKYPSGAVILLFPSVTHFKNRICEKSLLYSLIPTECILNKQTGIFYAPKNILKFTGNTKYPKLSKKEAKYKYLIISIIYNDYPKSELYVSYYTFLTDTHHLDTFFKRKKMESFIFKKTLF